MIDFLDWLGHLFAAFQITRDSGFWLVPIDAKARENFLESYLISKNKM